MKYKFINHSLLDLSPEETAILDDTLEFIMQYDRDAPFLDMAMHLAKISGADYAMIGEIIPERKDHIRTLAFVKGDTVLENLEYCSLNTPCENVMGHNVCYYPSGVQAKFPEDDYLRYLNLSSYMGSPLNDRHDNTIGLIALLSCQTIEKPGFLEYLLTTVSPFLEDRMAPNRIRQSF